MQGSDKTIDEAAATHLGQGGSYAVQTTQFDPTLLVRMPRQEARDEWGIKEDFVGVDVWRAYEATFLLSNGMPVSGTLKIVYESRSKYMVESKSLKLYLNTFDMCEMGPAIQIATQKYVSQIERDLSKLLSTNVKVGFFSEMCGNYEDNIVELFPHHYLLDREVHSLDKFTDYKGESNHIVFEATSFAEKENGGGNNFLSIGYRSNLLRSRCRHTKQKDSGSIFITIRSSHQLYKESFLKQIVSLREVNEFHEFCAEKIYSTILEKAKEVGVEVKDLMITCLYARRGGIDICPSRATSWDMIPEPMMRIDLLEQKTIMQ
jgi:7-cyano-7-deazaguanine reductase